jgi:hypothetical protein
VSETKYTPGPWKVNDVAPEEIYAYARTGPNAGAPGCVAMVYTHDFPAQAGPNARLMAAAPEMLGALKHLLHRYRYFEKNDQDAAIRQSIAAIAKAEGSQA